VADGEDHVDRPTQREVALSRAGQALFATLDSLPQRFPEAFSGRFGGPTNDDITIAVVEGAPGADELVSAVNEAARRSLEQVGVSFRFSFEPTALSHAALDAVRAQLADELIARGDLVEMGMTGVGLGRSRVAIVARVGSGPGVQMAVQRRFPDIPLEVRELRTPQPL